MKTNVKRRVEPIKTHGGAIAARCGKFEQLKRSVLSCMLWENEFYESGKTIASRIATLIAESSDPKAVSELTIEARNKYKIRHTPLFMAREAARHPAHREHVASTLAGIVNRPDELSEFMALYWEVKQKTDYHGKPIGTLTMKKQPIAASVKKGLARAFVKFDEYQLAKWNRDYAIKLRDVLFLCHAKPQDKAQEILWKKLIGGFCENTWTKLEDCKCKKCKEGKLAVPDTWETAKSAGKEKGKDMWERLMRDGKLGADACLKNLRKMLEEKVDVSLLEKYIREMNVSKVLPFQFITAAKYAPRLEGALNDAMMRCAASKPKLTGKTIIAVDVSGSMNSNVSTKSELSRFDAAFALAAIVRERCEEAVVYCTAGSDGARKHKTELIPARHGFALIDAMRQSYNRLGGGGIFLTQLMDYLKENEGKADRIIVITDEQDCDNKLNPSKANAFGGANYILNVGSAQNGIAYGTNWTHIHGYSEYVFDWMYEFEVASLQKVG